jgi:hypothetical protein
MYVCTVRMYVYVCVRVNIHTIHTNVFVYACLMHLAVYNFLDFTMQISDEKHKL